MCFLAVVWVAAAPNGATLTLVIFLCRFFRYLLS